MSELDYRKVAQKIAEDRPSGFRARAIKVNFELLDIDVAPRIESRIMRQFESVAQDVLNENVAVMGDNTLSEVWTYDLRHTCGQIPMYDAQNDEYYCPVCKHKDSIFDY